MESINPFPHRGGGGLHGHVCLGVSPGSGCVTPAEPHHLHASAARQSSGECISAAGSKLSLWSPVFHRSHRFHFSVHNGVWWILSIPGEGLWFGCAVSPCASPHSWLGGVRVRALLVFCCLRCPNPSNRVYNLNMRFLSVSFLWQIEDPTWVRL